MTDYERQLMYLAIDDSIKESTARKIVRYVAEQELGIADPDPVIAPSNEYLAKKFGWTINTTRVAISEAKKSQFIIITGYGKTRTLELNVEFLKSKMAEVAAKIPPRKTVDFSDILPPKSVGQENNNG